VHSGFLAYYQLNPEDGPPLLKLDLALDMKAPFQADS
jgi:hypothetical protein